MEDQSTEIVEDFKTEEDSMIVKSSTVLFDIINFFKGKNKEKKEDTNSSFSIWLTKDGSMRFLAAYSNNFRDNDNPAQIISSKSHKEFVDRVDAGDSKMPVLLHWHIKGTDYGKCDWVAYDEQNGIALASGTIIPGHEDEAMTLAEMCDKEDIALSHGMPFSSIQFDKEDDSVITRHDTIEISDLPRTSAANKFTALHFMKEEQDMSLPDKKKEYLKKLGFSDEKIESIENGNSTIKQIADEAGIESKEVAQAAAQPVMEEVKEESVIVESVYATKEMLDAIKIETAEAITTASTLMIESLSKQIKEMATAIVTLSEHVGKIDKERYEASNVTPMSSIASIVSRNLSAVGSKEAKVKEGDVLLSSKPAETSVEEVQQGDDVMSIVFRNILGGK